jgi:hypothetical protein
MLILVQIKKITFIHLTKRNLNVNNLKNPYKSYKTIEEYKINYKNKYLSNLNNYLKYKTLSTTIKFNNFFFT